MITKDAFDISEAPSLFGFFKRLFSRDFMPHGHCYFWRADILWLHVLSDLTIAVAYFAILVVLVYFARKRKDLPFGWMFLMFGAFIILCGMTHLMNICTTFFPIYRVEGLIKMITALVSITTAGLLIPLVPKALSLRSPGELDRLNDQLVKQTQKLREQQLAALNLAQDAEMARKQADQMTARLRRLATVVIDSNDAITMLDLDGKISAWNRGAERMYGYTESEALAMNIQEIIPEAKRQEALEFIAAAVPSFETQRVTKDGRTLDVWLTATKLVDEAGKPVGIATTERDVTEHRRLEKVQSQLIAQLENANQELKDFAYAVSHDLKAPLRGIDSLADWIMNDYQDKIDAEGIKQFQMMRERVKRMQALIDGILQYSALGRVREEQVAIDLNPLLKEIVETIAPPGHVRIEIQGKLPAIRADKTRIYQVFQNLLQNAVKFIDKPEGEVQVSCAGDGPNWRFSIADNGPGIEERYHAKIFQLFQTLGTKDKSENTGVGLALVKKIIETSGGKIWVESKVGQGSTFFFTLPKSLN